MHNAGPLDQRHVQSDTITFDIRFEHSHITVNRGDTVAALTCGNDAGDWPVILLAPRDVCQSCPMATCVRTMTHHSRNTT